MMQQASSGELTPWESPRESIYDVMSLEWRDISLPPVFGLARWPHSQPLLSHHLARQRTATIGADDDADIPTLGASAINASAINTSHGQECIVRVRDECCGRRRRNPGRNTLPCMSGLRIRGYAISKPRYSAAVNATLRQSCGAFLPSFFFCFYVMHLPLYRPARTRSERQADCRCKPFGGELRTLDRQANPLPLDSSSLFFFA